MLLHDHKSSSLDGDQFRILISHLKFDITAIGTLDLENIPQNTVYQFQPELCQSIGTTKGGISFGKDICSEYPLEFHSGMWFGVTAEQMARHFLVQAEEMYFKL